MTEQHGNPDNVSPPQGVTPPSPPRRPPPSLMQNLGSFFGHIARGFKTPVAPPAPSQPVSATVREETRQTPAGPITYRETVIREVVAPPPAPPGQT